MAIPSKSDINPATGQAYAVNPATGVWDDTYWAEVVEPQLKAQYGEVSGGAEDYVSKLIETLTRDIVPSALEFDPEASRRAMEEEWDPYFDELLQDYLTEVGLGRTREEENLATYLETLGLRGGRAETDVTGILGLLGGRREEYLADIARESPLIQEAIGGRAADVGLYFGGQREERQRLQLEKEQRARETYQKEYEYKVGRAETGLERTQEDIAREREQRELESERYLADIERKRKQRERELARERERAITGGVETLREEKYRGW